MGRRSDKQLLAAIRSGDLAARAEFVEDNYKAIYRMLARLSRDSHAAEDLTQETFASAWANLGGFKQQSALSTWLYRIAYLKFVDWQRRGQSRQRLMDKLAGAGPGPSDKEPLETIAAQEQVGELLQAVERLETAEQEVIVLHYMQGLSLSQVAEVLEQPGGTVKWRLNRALIAIKTMLEKGKGYDGHLENP